MIIAELSEEISGYPVTLTACDQEAKAAGYFLQLQIMPVPDVNGQRTGDLLRYYATIRSKTIVDYRVVGCSEQNMDEALQAAMEQWRANAG